METIGSSSTPEVLRAGLRGDAYAPGTKTPRYLNFVELDAAGEDRVRAAYPPEDWDRLVALKDAHDPENPYRFNRNIRPS